MKQIWNIFRADWKRLTASVVAVVVMLGLCLVPCLYAWFNILSNWDPYGTASTSRIKVAVASEDDGCDVLGLHVNIGELVLRGLESNDQMGWVFVDDAQTALDGVNAGDYYAALILPPEFTGDFVSILEGDLRHPQIQYYENEKKNAIAPKITSKAKTAVQEQINTTILEKVADALTTAGSVFKAMGLDGRDIAGGLLEKLSAAQRDMDELAQVLRSLQDVMDGADSLLAASAITITDARSTLGDASETVGSTVRLIGSGLDAADDASADLLRVLDAADDTLSDLEDMLGAVDMGPADDAAHEKVNARIDKMIAALETARDLTSDEDVQAQLDAAISGLEELRTSYDQQENAIDAAQETVAALMKSGVPMLGIDLGHQLMALAMEGSVEKMHCGHRGANCPVTELASGRTFITSQNHGYIVKDVPACAVVSHLNSNDKTCEGLEYPQMKALSVQFIPESEIGMKNFDGIYERFLSMIK